MLHYFFNPQNAVQFYIKHQGATEFVHGLFSLFVFYETLFRVSI